MQSSSKPTNTTSQGNKEQSKGLSEVSRARSYVLFSEARYASACGDPQRAWEEEIEMTVIDGTSTRGSGEMFMRWYRIEGLLSPRLEIYPDGWRVLANLTPSILEELGQVDNQDITPAYFRGVLERCGFVDVTPRA